MKKLMAAIILLFCMQSTCYAAVHFDVEKVIWKDGEYKEIKDTKNHVIYSWAGDYDWSKDDDIPTIEKMPDPNIIMMQNGYITKIDGEYYWAGRTGDRAHALPIFPLGQELPENLEEPSWDKLPNLFPYNSRDLNIVYEDPQLNEKLRGLKSSFGDIGKWVFGRNKNGKTCIFVDGIYGIETNLNFWVDGHPVLMRPNDIQIMFWEDDDTFYIKNYNILLKTPKEPLYEALRELENVPKIKLDDTILAFSVPPVIESDRTLVPMRFLFEQMGADVEWNQERKEATATMGETVITFGIDNTTATVNGEEVTMDVPARLINDKTMVPLRFLSENMGYTVDWDGETRTAIIEK